MPKYVRYGYVTQKTTKYQGELVTCETIAFHLNPKLAMQFVDSMSDESQLAKEDIGAVQTIEDTTFTQLSGLVAQVLRRVLIKYLDGSTVLIITERWGVEVGKE